MLRRSAIASIAWTLVPRTRTTPSLGSERRLISRSSVVLPDPDPPTTARNSRLPTLTLARARAGGASPYRLVTSISEIAGCMRVTMRVGGPLGNPAIPTITGHVLGCWWEDVHARGARSGRCDGGIPSGRWRD